VGIQQAEPRLLRCLVQLMAEEAVVGAGLGPGRGKKIGDKGAGLSPHRPVDGHDADLPGRRRLAEQAGKDPQAILRPDEVQRWTAAALLGFLLRGVADLGPAAPIDAEAGQSLAPTPGRQSIQKGIGSRVVGLSTGSQQGGHGREENEEIQGCALGQG
jgi:hypothetical protein